MRGLRTLRGANLHAGVTTGRNYPSDVNSLLVSSNVQQVVACGNGFAAIVSGGVVSWGALRVDQGTAPGLGAYPQDVRAQLTTGVSAIFAYNAYGVASSAVAAIGSLGQVVAFGTGDAANLYKGSAPATVTIPAIDYPGDIRALVASGIETVVASANALAAISDTGAVIAWGHDLYGGNLALPVDIRPLVASNVVSVFATAYAFARAPRRRKGCGVGRRQQRRLVHPRKRGESARVSGRRFRGAIERRAAGTCRPARHVGFARLSFLYGPQSPLLYFPGPSSLFLNIKMSCPFASRPVTAKPYVERGALRVFPVRDIPPPPHTHSALIRPAQCNALADSICTYHYRRMSPAYSRQAQEHE